MKCKNLKIKSKKGIKKGYCKLYDKEVSIFCNECPFEVKYDKEKISKSNNRQLRNRNKTAINSQKSCKTNKSIKKRSSRLAKAEKNRFSIIYQDLTKCCVEGCLTPYYGVQKNEVFDGSYRQASIIHGMVCPMCDNCHKRFHNDREFALYYKRIFQDKFVEEHSIEEFLEIFKINYHFRK